MSNFKFMLIGWLLVSFAIAQDRGQPRKVEQPEILKTFVQFNASRLEAELATLIQKRAETPANDLPYQELRIDLRILQRWLIQQLLKPTPYSDTQAVIWLRQKDLSDLIITVDGFAAGKSGEAPTRKQSDAMTAIHKMTFDLKPIDGIAALDAMLTPLRSSLLFAMGDQTGKSVDMRPAPVKNTQVVEAPDKPVEQPQTLDQLSTGITRLTVSIPLRQQLLSSVAATRQAEGDEQAAMLDMLRSAYELASALQSNIGVDAASRPVIEAQLGEAVSLFSDPRLREAAESRMKNLAQYRQLAGRVSSLVLAPEIVRALAPAFAYARAHPEASAKVLQTIEAFSDIESQVLSLKPPAAAASDHAHRQAEAQFKQLLNLRAGFIEDAEKMSGSGKGTSTADDLSQRVDSMRTTIASLNILKRHPQTMATLLELKPRPFGALERRVTQSLVKMSDDDAARSFIADLDRIAGTWTMAQKALEAPVDPQIVEKYAATNWQAFEARFRQVVTDSVNVAASTGKVDVSKIESLDRLVAMIQRLRTLANLDSRLQVEAGVNRWADCSINNEKLTKLLDGYRTDFAAIVKETLQGGGDEKEASRLADRYRGLFTTLDAISTATDASQQLPQGPLGQVARFTTPSDKAPYRSIRYLSLMTDLIDLTRMSTTPDPDAINRLETEMLDRLNK